MKPKPLTEDELSDLVSPRSLTADNARLAAELEAAKVVLRAIAASWRRVAGLAFCESSEREGSKVTIRYPRLEQAQDAYRAMGEITAALDASEKGEQPT